MDVSALWKETKKRLDEKSTFLPVEINVPELHTLTKEREIDRF